MSCVALLASDGNQLGDGLAQYEAQISFVFNYLKGLADEKKITQQTNINIAGYCGLNSGVIQFAKWYATEHKWTGVVNICLDIAGDELQTYIDNPRRLEYVREDKEAQNRANAPLPMKAGSIRELRRLERAHNLATGIDMVYEITSFNAKQGREVFVMKGCGGTGSGGEESTYAKSLMNGASALYVMDQLRDDEKTHLRAAMGDVSKANREIVARCAALCAGATTTTTTTIVHTTPIHCPSIFLCELADYVEWKWIVAMATKQITINTPPAKTSIAALINNNSSSSTSSTTSKNTRSTSTPIWCCMCCNQEADGKHTLTWKSEQKTEELCDDCHLFLLQLALVLNAVHTQYDMQVESTPELILEWVDKYIALFGSRDSLLAESLQMLQTLSESGIRLRAARNESHVFIEYCMRHLH